MQRSTPSPIMPVINSPARLPGLPGMIQLEKMSDVEARLTTIFLKDENARPFIADVDYFFRVPFSINGHDVWHEIQFSSELCRYEGKKGGGIRYAVLDEEIGSGSFGSVFLVKRTLKINYDGMAVCKLKKSTKWRAIKIFDQHNAILCSNKEYEILKLIPSMRVKLNQESSVQSQASLLMAYVPGQDLFDCLQAHQNRSKQLNVLQRLELSRELCAALYQVHHLGIIHRDVKPENIRVSFNADGSINRAVCIDFNLAKQRGSAVDGKERVGTAAFFSPEAFANTLQDEKSDIYSLGRVLCCVWGLQWNFDNPFQDASQLINYFTSLPRFDFLFSDVADPALSSGQRQRIHDLLFATNNKQQADRPTAAAAMQLFETIISEYKEALIKREPGAIAGSLRADAADRTTSVNLAVDDRSEQMIPVPVHYSQQASAPLFFSPVRAAAAPAPAINNQSNNPGCVLF